MSDIFISLNFILLVIGIVYLLTHTVVRPHYHRRANKCHCGDNGSHSDEPPYWHYDDCPVCHNGVEARWVPDDGIIPEGWTEDDKWSAGIMGGPCYHCEDMRKKIEIEISDETDIELNYILNQHTNMDELKVKNKPRIRLVPITKEDIKIGAKFQLSLGETTLEIVHTMFDNITPLLCIERSPPHYKHVRLISYETILNKRWYKEEEIKELWVNIYIDEGCLYNTLLFPTEAMAKLHIKGIGGLKQVRLDI